MPNFLSALQEAYSKIANFGKPLATNQPQTAWYQQQFNEATKNFTPEAMVRAKNVPVQFVAPTKHGYIPGGIYDSGLVTNNLGGFAGVYGLNYGDPNSAGITMRADLGEATPEVLRHEMVHSMDANINMPRMLANPNDQREDAEQVMDPIMGRMSLFKNLIDRAYLLNSTGIGNHLTPQNRQFLGNFGAPEYSQSDREALAYLNDQEPSAGSLSKFYGKAIQYAPNTLWSKTGGRSSGATIPTSRLKIKGKK